MLSHLMGLASKKKNVDNWKPEPVETVPEGKECGARCCRMGWIEEAVILNGDTSAGQEAARWYDKNMNDEAAWEKDKCELDRYL